MFIADTAEVDPEWYKDTLAYKLCEEARGEAREEGRREVREEARREVAIDTIRRFLMIRVNQIVSPPPIDVIDRIYKANLGDLEVWLERAMTSASLSEVFT